MKIILMFLSFSLQIFAQGNWTPVNSGTTVNLNDVCFVNDNYGWIISSFGILLRTTDGGENWDASSLSYTSLGTIKFLNENEGWMIGGYGLILKTTDSGNTWIEQPGGQNYILTDLYLQNNQVGFICGYSGYREGVVLKSTNGGESWERYASPFREKLKSVFFINSNIGWLTGDWGTIYKTSNAGASWDSVSSITSNRYGVEYTGTIFLDTLKGFTCNWYDYTGTWGGEIYKTSDGGYTWNLIANTFAELNDIVRDPFSNLLYTVGYNYNIIHGVGNSIYYSTNVGDTWIEETNPVYPYLRAIDFTPNHTGWAVGLNGTILKSSNSVNNDSSSTDSTEISNSPENFSLYQNYPNPFNPGTKIKYELPEFSKIQLTVYNVLGRKVKTLVNEEKPAGLYEVEFDGTNLPSGIYFYKIEAGSYTQTRKMILLR